MEFAYDTRKTVHENAAEHYERAKKLKAKIPGMKKAIKASRKKLEDVPEEVEEKPGIKKRRERRWYEKFRWFRSSDGLLVIGGRDATTNEILIKKHTDAKDLVFHANVQGAPFFTVKAAGEVPEQTRKEAAAAAASYSKAWSRGMGACDVYEVTPEQVSKSPPSGEYLPKGAFMVYGEKTWHRNVELKVAVGLAEDRIIGGPVDAVKAHAEKHVTVGVGDVSQGQLAKQVKAKLGGSLDEIQRFLPPGGGRIL